MEFHEISTKNCSISDNFFFIYHSISTIHTLSVGCFERNSKDRLWLIVSDQIPDSSKRHSLTITSVNHKLILSNSIDQHMSYCFAAVHKGCCKGTLAAESQQERSTRLIQQQLIRFICWQIAMEPSIDTCQKSLKTDSELYEAPI